ARVRRALRDDDGTTGEAARDHAPDVEAPASPALDAPMNVPPAPAAHCGTSIAGGYDFNRDGYMDMVVGEPSYDEPNETNEGRVRVFFGKPGSMDFNAAFTFEGGCAGCRLGRAVAAVYVVSASPPTTTSRPCPRSSLLPAP